MLLAGLLLARLLLEKLPESVASDAIIDSGKALAHRIGRKNLEELIVESIKEAAEQSAREYGDIRQDIFKSALKALECPSAKEIIRRRSDALLRAKFTSEEFKQLSQELAATIYVKSGISKEDIERVLRESLRLFHDHLLAKIAEDQRLTNFLGLKLGIQNALALESLTSAFRASRKDTQSAFQPFTILPLSDLRKLDTVLHYNPPQSRLHGYVPREEIDFDPSGRRIIILGTPGSGKTTALLKILERAKSGTIAVIHRSFSADDILGLLNAISIGESIILVWDDLHWVGEPSLVPTTICKILEVTSNPTLILAARSNEFESLRRKVSEHFWSMFEKHQLVDLDTDQTRRLVDICKQEFDVTMDEELEKQLISVVKEADPTPLYIVSAILALKGKSLEATDIHRIPASARDIWAGLFSSLDSDNKNVLRSLKLLDEAQLPPLHWLASAIYECVFRGDETKFQSALDQLSSMGWVRSLGSRIQCHDLQLEAVQIDDLSYDNLRFLSSSLNLTPEGKFTVLHHFGIVLDRRGRYNDARALLEESLAIERDVGNNLSEALTLHQLGKIEQAIGNYDVAQKLYEQSLEIKRKLRNEASIPSTLHQLGVLAYLKGDYDAAKRLYGEAESAFRKFDDQSGLAGVLHQLALIEKERGNLDESAKLAEQSLRISQTLGDQEAVPQDVVLLAQLEDSRGNRDTAKRLYAEAENAFRELGDQVGLAIVLHQLSMMLQDEGNLDESLRLCNESLRIEQKIGHPLGIAGSLNQLGRIQFQKGNYDEAQRFYEASLEITGKLGNQSESAQTLHSLGVIEYMRGNYDKATKLYNQALEVYGLLGMKAEIASVLYQFGNMAVSKENYDDAKTLYEQCLEIDREVENPLGIARTLVALGRVDALKDNFENARKLFNESLAIARKLGNISEEATANAQLGSLAEAEGDVKSAVKLWSQALQIFEQIGEREKADNLRPELKRLMDRLRLGQ